MNLFDGRSLAAAVARRETATHVVVVCPISKMQELPLRGLLRSAGQ